MLTTLRSIGLMLVLAVGIVALADQHSGDATPGSGGGEHHAIPVLPFDDNPDPDACGIPQRWGSDDVAWLDGHYEGELIEPVVHLYDSHLRREITGHLPTGSEVRIALFQDNPVLNYYLIEGIDPDGVKQSGWVPAPFVALEPPGTMLSPSGE